MCIDADIRGVVWLRVVHFRVGSVLQTVRFLLQFLCLNVLSSLSRFYLNLYYYTFILATYQLHTIKGNSYKEKPFLFFLLIYFCFHFGITLACFLCCIISSFISLINKHNWTYFQSHDLLDTYAHCAFYFHLHIICHPHIFSCGLFCITRAWETALSPRYRSLMSLPSCLLHVNINLHLYCTLFCAPLSGPLVLVYKHA